LSTRHVCYPLAGLIHSPRAVPNHGYWTKPIQQFERTRQLGFLHSSHGVPEHASPAAPWNDTHSQFELIQGAVGMRDSQHPCAQIGL
ncbi:MAG: hypothetical protein AAF933_12500, partial [Pseudomonadota bacterium]